MDSALRWLTLALVSSTLSLSAQEKPSPKKGADAAQEAVKVPVEQGEVDMEQVREELGVNGFTAPSIEHILAELMDMRPIPIEKLWRDIKPDVPQDRGLIALSAGRVIADGLMAVISEKPSRVEPCARALLRYAKGLGVSDHVSRHAKSILERAARENWLDVRKELVKSQADVEAGMLALKDEEIAHLVSLGGWMRGLEIVSALVADDYTPERAKALVQPEAVDYFSDRVATLNPRLKRNPVLQTIEKNLKAIRAIIVKEGDKPPTQDEVKELRKLAGEVVDQI
jgi:hypothetical protein